VSSSQPPRVDVFVCEGRVCTSKGAAAVAAEVASCFSSRHDEGGGAAPNARVRRGGCYGLCDLGPNVVVRRVVAGGASGRTIDGASGRTSDGAIDDDADRLSLRGGDHEDVCVAVAPVDVAALVAGVIASGRPPAQLLRAAREPTLPPRSPIEARLRALRALRGTTKGAVVDASNDRGGQGGT
jgi:(2Fe-2S) ferredoxin